MATEMASATAGMPEKVNITATAGTPATAETPATTWKLTTARTLETAGTPATVGQQQKRQCLQQQSNNSNKDYTSQSCNARKTGTLELGTQVHQGRLSKKLEGISISHNVLCTISFDW
jgi:hypothetical protein